MGGDLSPSGAGAPRMARAEGVGRDERGGWVDVARGPSARGVDTAEQSVGRGMNAERELFRVVTAADWSAAFARARREKNVVRGRIQQKILDVKSKQASWKKSF